MSLPVLSPSQGPARQLGIATRILVAYIEGRLPPLFSKRIGRALKLGIPLKLLDALDTSEVPDCGCKLSLTPVCLIGAKPGCRQRQQEGTCPCRPRWLPGCQLDHPGGCERRREGKSCKCEPMYMPECLSPGCPKRRRGRLCDCPRWPGQPCQHITSYPARMRFLAAALVLEAGSPRGSDPDSGWCVLLYTLFPKRYRGPRLQGAAANLIDRQTRVAKYAARRAARLQLFHPDDILYPQSEYVDRRLRCHSQAFAQLLACPERSVHGHRA